LTGPLNKKWLKVYILAYKEEKVRICKLKALLLFLNPRLIKESKHFKVLLK